MLASVGLMATSCTQRLYTTHTPLGEQVRAVGNRMTATEDRATGLYGYLSDVGLWAIPPQYHSAQDFSNGMARVGTGRAYGAINPLGQWVIKPVFRSSVDCDGAMNSIRKGRLVGIELWETEDPQTELYGYLNHFGEWQIPPQFEHARAFDRYGFAVVKAVGGGWGVINKQVQWVIQPNFKYAHEAESALSRLKR